MQRPRLTILAVLLLVLVSVGALLCFVQYAARSEVRQARLDRSLVNAVDRHDVSAVQSLLDQGADPNTREEGTPTKPWLSRMADALLRRKKIQTFLGRPLLTRAAGAGYNQIVALLLSHGADVGAKTDTPDDEDDLGQGKEDDWSTSSKGATALIDATENNQTQAALLLLRAGTDVNAVDADGNSALMNAAFRDSPAVVQVLLLKGAKVGARDKDGDTPLIVATFANNFVPDKLRSATVHNLLAAGADVDAADNDGCTALMNAAEVGPPNEDRSRTTQVLLAYGARVGLKDKHGETALMKAESGRHARVAALLNQLAARP